MTGINSKQKRGKAPAKSVKLLAATAMFAALVTVTTSFIKMPTMLGYAHAGDGILYIGAAVLPGPFGVIAASLGGALADLLSGYAHWAIPTAIIKALNAIPFALCGYALKKCGKNEKIINLPNLLMLLPTSAVTVLGYLVANAAMKGWEASIANTPNNLIQAAVGAAIFVALGLTLDGLKFKSLIKDFI
ncbi:MAG: ECF transporter S component [Ruminococcus sp.]|nr:ECF transporter S component [Ruminococcus sp.]